MCVDGIETILFERKSLLVYIGTFILDIMDDGDLIQQREGFV